MPNSEFQQNQVSKLYFPGSYEASRLGFNADNKTQSNIYTLAHDYEYVLREFHKNGRQVRAVMFLRQVSSDRYGYVPNLSDTKKVADHMWSKFDSDNSPAGM